MSSVAAKNYRKHVNTLPTHTIEYVDNNNKSHSFHCTKQMLRSHEILMSNNQFIKRFKVKNYESN